MSNTITDYPDEQSAIDTWTREYIGGKNLDCFFKGYIELAISDGYRMGCCRCEWSPTVKKVKAEIWLDDDHAKVPQFFRDAVLWHEFCHYWDCVESFHVDHCMGFRRKKWRKPAYALGDLLLKFIGWIWFD